MNNIAIHVPSAHHCPLPNHPHPKPFSYILHTSPHPQPQVATAFVILAINWKSFISSPSTFKSYSSTNNIPYSNIKKQPTKSIYNTKNLHTTQILMHKHSHHTHTQTLTNAMSTHRYFIFYIYL